MPKPKVLIQRNALNEPFANYAEIQNHRELQQTQPGNEVLRLNSGLDTCSA
jgi:hypothetical protein